MHDIAWLLILATVVILALWIIHARISTVEEKIAHEIHNAENRVKAHVSEIRNDTVQFINRIHEEKGMD